MKTAFFSRHSVSAASRVDDPRTLERARHRRAVIVRAVVVGFGHLLVLAGETAPESTAKAKPPLRGAAACV